MAGRGTLCEGSRGEDVLEEVGRSGTEERREGRKRTLKKEGQLVVLFVRLFFLDIR